MGELLINRTDEFDRNYVELIGEKAFLPAFWIDGLQKIRNTLKVFGCRCILDGRGREHITVEGLAEPTKELTGCRAITQDRW